MKPRHDRIHDHEAFVAARFDATSPRFRRVVSEDDARLEAILSALPSLDGLRILDLGCGKGRFASELQERGACVTGLDLSAAMLSEAKGINRVRGSARRLPFAAGSFDAAVAVEVFEHLAHDSMDDVCRELNRVLAPGKTLVVIDKNLLALDAGRPWLPKVLVKWIDQKRGRWMYGANEPVRERWFRPGALGRRLGRSFVEVQVAHLLSRFEHDKWVFRHLPMTRLFVRWMARTAGGTA